MRGDADKEDIVDETDYVSGNESSYDEEENDEDYDSDSLKGSQTSKKQTSKKGDVGLKSNL